MKEKEIKELLLKDSEEFRKAFEEHQRYEKELEGFSKKSYLSEEEVMKVKELKKKKLALKDRMYFLMNQYMRSHR